MSTWFELRPVGGWEAFDRGCALTAFLWSRLDPADWHYLNFTSGTSAWEHRGEPEGTIFVGYEAEAVVELRVKGEAVAGVISDLVDTFDLTRVPEV